MNVIFIGTSEFAVPSLEALIASRHDVATVVTQPDKPKGRGREMQQPPVKEVALAHDIPVLQPEKIRSPEAVEQIKEYGPVDVIVVAAYGQIIPKELLYWPKHGAINVHGSILPKYRGAAPIQYAIIMGEQETGVTTMLMDEGLDTGDILLQRSLPINPSDNVGELTPRLARLGADLLLDTLQGLEDGRIAPMPQDDELATQARSLPRNFGAIDWSLPAPNIVNLIHGVTPRPGAFTKLHDTQIKIWNAEVAQPDGKAGEPGQVIEVSNDGIAVAAGDGSVRLLEVQPASRKRMTSTDWARGSKVDLSDRFDVRSEME